MSFLSNWWQGTLKKGFFISFRLPWFGEKNEPDNLNIYPNDKQVEEEDQQQIMKGGTNGAIK